MLTMTHLNIDDSHSMMINNQTCFFEYVAVWIMIDPYDGYVLYQRDFTF